MDANNVPKNDVWILTAPHWVAIFMSLSVAISLVPFIIGFVAGLSVASDVVFGVYALISGVCAHFICSLLMHRTLLVWRKPRILFVFLWIPLCLYVIVFQPFAA